MRAICQFFDEKLTVVLYDTTSPAEKTLLAVGKEEFAKNLRSELHEAIAPQLKAIVESIVGVSVISISIDSDLVTGYSGFTVILSETPPVRDSQSIPKVNRSKTTESSKE